MFAARVAALGLFFDPADWSTTCHLMAGSFASGFEGVASCPAHFDSVVRLNSCSDAITV